MFRELPIQNEEARFAHYRVLRANDFSSATDVRLKHQLEEEWTTECVEA